MQELNMKKVLYNEISLMIGGIALVSSVIFWITNPQTDLQMQIVKLQTASESNATVVATLEKIKNNDFVEIHVKLKEVEENQAKIMQALSVIQYQLRDKK